MDGAWNQHSGYRRRDGDLSVKTNMVKAIRYEEALLRNYINYAKDAGDTELGRLFLDLAQETQQHINKLRAAYKTRCKP